jgi:tetratricopeptide (TPR) repeat protein
MLAAAAGLSACARARPAAQGPSGAAQGACDGFEQEPQRFWTASARSGARAGILRATGDYAAALADRVTKGMDEATANWATVQRNACIDAVERKTMTPEVYAMVSACTRICLASQRTIARAMQSPTAEQVFGLDLIMGWLKRDPAVCLLEAQYAAYAPRESDRLAVVAARDGTAKAVGTAAIGTSDLDVAQQALGEAWALGQTEDGPRWRAAIERGIAAARRAKDPKALVEFVLSDARRLEDLESRPQGALERAREAEQIARQAGDAEGLRNSHFRIGSICQSLGKYREAIDSFQKALALTEKAFGKEHRETALMHARMAGVYADLGNVEKVLSLRRKAFTVLEKAVGPDDMDTVDAAESIGAAYEMRDKHDSALEWFRKGLATEERLLGTDHPYVANTYAGIGYVYAERGDYPEALEWLQKTLAVREKTLGKDHPDTADAHAEIASVYERQDKHAEALDLYRRALAIREKGVGAERPGTARIHNSMGMVYCEQGKYAEGLACFEKARAIQEKALGHDNDATGQSYQNIGMANYKLGKIAEALKALEEALAILERSLGKDHKAIGRTYDDIEYLCSNDNYQPACDFVQEHPRSVR